MTPDSGPPRGTTGHNTQCNVCCQPLQLSSRGLSDAVCGVWVFCDTGISRSISIFFAQSSLCSADNGSHNLCFLRPHAYSVRVYGHPNHFFPDITCSTSEFLDCWFFTHLQGWGWHVTPCCHQTWPSLHKNIYHLCEKIVLPVTISWGFCPVSVLST